jgi:hypothetical protein
MVKPILIWITEIVAEALLSGCFFGVLLSSQIGLLYGVMGGLIVLPWVLLLHWYYLTRALAAAVRSIRPQLYPGVAATLFVIHMHIAFVRLEPDMSSLGKAMELPLVAGGACIVFACALAGNWLLRKWAKRAGNGFTEVGARTIT